MLSGRRKLLLADDSPTIQKVVSLTFEDEMEVVSVSDGAQALRLLETGEPPDILLADVWMPGPNGYELCEHVKRDARLRHIPVVLLVGTFEPFNEAEARRVGADTILTKPFQSIRNLVSKVGSLLGGGSSKHEEEDAASQTSQRNESAEEAKTLRADVPVQHAYAEATGDATGDERVESFGPESASSYADLGADDELIEARPADSFGAAELSEAWRAPAASQAQSASEESVVAEMYDAEAFVEQHAEERAHETVEVSEQPFAAHEAQAAPSFAASGRESGEAVFAAQSSFAARAGAAAAADDALLDLGQFQTDAAHGAEESDDFVLDIDFDEPAPSASRTAAHEAHAFDAAAFDDQPAANMQSDAASAFAEAAHGEPVLAYDEPAPSYDEPAASYDEHASSFGETDTSFAPLESSASAPASVWEEQNVAAEVVMQDEPQSFISSEVGGAQRGFVEPSVVPADEPIPVAVEAEFTDGSVEGDTAKAPVVDYTTQPVAEEAVREPETPPAPERFVPAEPSPAGFAVGHSRAGLESPLRADQLSPEAVETIAHRVVELMSDKVVREIAWEVVPELAELLIKRKLDEERQK